MQRRGRLLEDRASGGVQMVAATGAGPGLALLLRRVALEHSLRLALGAVGVLTIGGVPLAPEVLQASLVIRELVAELLDGVERLRGGDALRDLAVRGRHLLPLSV